MIIYGGRIHNIRQAVGTQALINQPLKDYLIAFYLVQIAIVNDEQQVAGFLIDFKDLTTKLVGHANLLQRQLTIILMYDLSQIIVATYVHCAVTGLKDHSNARDAGIV